MTELLQLWMADYRLFFFFSTGGAQYGLGFGVLPAASAITAVLMTPPVVPHIVAVAGGARSSGSSGPPPLAALPFPGPPLQSVTLPVWSSQSTMASSPISLTPSGSGMCLSPGSDPCPHKLTEKVQFGIYAEMKELLVDNLSL